MGQAPSKPAAKPASIKNGLQSPVPSTQTLEPPLPHIGPEDAVIAVMGLTGVGKSTFISHFSDTAVVGNDLESCTSTISIHPVTIDEETIYLIDTPGFDDTNRTDTDILGEIATWLERSYSANIKLAGLVYLHRIQDNRVGGSGTKNIHMFRELCGQSGLSSVVLATTMWDSLSLDKAIERETELKTKEEFWGGLVAHGCEVRRQDDGAASATEIIRHILAQRRPITLQIQEEIAEGMALHETAAGGVLKAELEEQRRVYEERAKELEEQLRKVASELAGLQVAQAARDEQVKEEREREQRDNEKRELERETMIRGLKEELNGLKEEVASTRQKQEKTEAEYKDLTSRRGIFGWCVVM